MIFYLGGSENPGHRKKLLAWGCKSLAFNFKHLAPRLPKTKPWVLADHLPDDVQAMVYFEVPEEAPEMVRTYIDWVETNIGRLAFAVEPDGVDEQTLAEVREQSSCIPIWRPETGHRALQRLADDYSGIVVPQSAWENTDRPVTPRVNRLVQGEGTHIVGLGVSKPEILDSVAFGSVSTGSWTSAMRYGETQIWDGSELRRFPATDKEARRRYRAQIARSGLDVDKIFAEDRDEVCRLAVWSWQQYEEWLSRRREVSTDVSIGRVVIDTKAKSGHGEIAARSGEDPTTTRRKGGTIRTRETKPLPLLQTGLNDNAEGTFKLTTGTQRVCDQCTLSEVCPEYEGGASCAFDIPVEIRTKDQLLAMLNGALEMQLQRVMFARFREDLEGTTDRIVSEELDRLMNMTEKYRDLVDNSDTLKVQIEARGQMGVLSSLFGAKVGAQARQLPGGGLDSTETESLLARVVDAAVVAPIVLDTNGEEALAE